MRPTIVLVHGAFVDPASWDSVIDTLLDAGCYAVAAASPLRSLRGDAAAVSDEVRSIDGPVVLVAHSYGGMVVSNVDAGAGDITGLVYVAAFAPDVGESAFSLAEMLPGSTLGDAVRPTPRADGASDLSIAPDRFHAQLCADVPDAQARRMAVTQRPATLEALQEPTGRAATRAEPPGAGTRRERSSRRHTPGAQPLQAAAHPRQ